MDENEGADSWLRYCSGNGDDGRLRCCHEMVKVARRRKMVVAPLLQIGGGRRGDGSGGCHGDGGRGEN
ncbi:hypothetical protein DEO72_LG5g2069 [Vigna unguiculata]|uniref:Uncharacterized protein n=1 Tax=Vigna unguiculata TaxID=3917 RepID=A0A4D6M0B1_VIGUN|nr:hypothetical protein DEO72_LG5g2069 [Vigna unguiculata]